MILSGGLRSVKATKHSKMREDGQRTLWGQASRIIHSQGYPDQRRRERIYSGIVQPAVSRIGILPLYTAPDTY